jgi:hypothetical protein
VENSSTYRTSLGASSSVPLAYLLASYDVRYELVVKLASALMTFSCEFDGKTVGSVEANYKT